MFARRYPQWRLFRDGDAPAVGLGPAAYIALFALCLGIGWWSVERYETVLIWPANGVLLAALLRLPRHSAISVLSLCFVLNLVVNVLRHDPPHMVLMNAVLNFGEVLLAGLLARRFCGATLDLRRPARLARFVFFAVAPSVALSAFIGVTITGQGDAPPFLINLMFWFTIETLGFLTTTPTLLLFSQKKSISAPVWETIALFALLTAVTTFVFAQSVAPILFVVFVPLLIMAFRLPPHLSALGVVWVAVIATGFTLNEHGPLMLSRVVVSDPIPFARVLPLFHLFISAALAVSFGANTVITERQILQARLKKRSEALIRARMNAEAANVAKSQFLTTMSHELRTPLNAVIGYSEMLMEDADERGSARERQDLDRIHRAAYHLLALINDVLDLSKIEAARMVPVAAIFDAQSLVLEAVEGVAPNAAANSVTISVEGASGLGAGVTDEVKVRQCLINLLSNAAKFTHDGRIVVHCARERAADKDWLVFEIEDTGIGISAEAQARLFEPFEQADASITRLYGGTGLGLAISRRLARLLGGDITVRSALGQGSTFTLRVPAALPRELPNKATVLHLVPRAAA